MMTLLTIENDDEKQSATFAAPASLLQRFALNFFELLKRYKATLALVKLANEIGNVVCRQAELLADATHVVGRDKIYNVE